MTAILLMETTASAEIQFSGDVAPDPRSTSVDDDLFIGLDGLGQMAIDEGSLAFSREAIVGAGSTGAGTAVVRGASSHWRVQEKLTVGGEGVGTVVAREGGALSAFRLRIGDRNGSIGTFLADGPGTLVNVMMGVDVGRAGAAVLTIQNGAVLYSGWGGLAQGDTANALVVVDGSGSAWNLSSDLEVGGEGTGQLIIRHGGTVNVSETLVVNPLRTKSRVVLNGGVLQAESVFASNADLLGVGEIQTSGWIFDEDVLIAGEADLTRRWVIGDFAGQNIGIDLDLTSTTGSHARSAGIVGAGMIGEGSLTIRDGVVLRTNGGVLGFGAQSRGLATIAGNGTVWSNRETVYVGKYGEGLLSVEDGAQAGGGGDLYLGYGKNATGELSVRGFGSSWSTGDVAFIGGDGHGRLSVQQGGNVEFEAAVIAEGPEATGVVTIEGPGSSMVVRNRDDEDRFSFTVGYGGEGSLTVRAGGSLSSNGVSIGHGGKGVVRIEGQGSQWQNGQWMTVGLVGEGTLQITDGAAVQAFSAQIGAKRNGQGSAFVSGSGSVWQLDDRLVVGDEGAGELTIENGALVTSRFGNVNGEVMITGSGSAWEIDEGLFLSATQPATIRLSDQGRLAANHVRSASSESRIVFDGGTLATTSLLISTDQLVGEGVLELSGWGLDQHLEIDSPGALVRQFSLNESPNQDISVHVDLRNESLMILGNNARGSMSLSRGVELRSAGAYVGMNPESDGVVDIEGAGTAWEIADFLIVGFFGRGTVTLESGASLLTPSTSIGLSNHSDGRVVLRGEDTLWKNNGRVLLGAAQPSRGRIDVLDGANFQSGRLILGAYLDGTGIITVEGAGSKVDILDDLIVGYSGKGTFSVAHGGFVRSGSAVIGNSPFSSGAARIRGMGSVWETAGDLVVFNGQLAVEDGGSVAVGGDVSIGVFEGDADLPGKLSFGVSANGPGALNIQGALHLGDHSILELFATEGIVPPVGQSYQVVTADMGITGVFASTTLGPLNAISRWQVEMGPTQIAAHVIAVSPLPGDTNGDGLVDVVDLNNVRNHFGSAGPDDGTLVGDTVPFDGRVDVSDVNAVRNHFGSAAPVPEPHGVVLMSLAACAAASRLRRIRRGK